jgi:SAM-dependent methyltransferase|tara:strand:- start:1303 stop:1941 length:639 start_codon:yes stop_codon:yes gene_type:complete
MGTYQKSNYYDEAYGKGTYDVEPKSLHHYHMNWSAAVDAVTQMIHLQRRGEEFLDTGVKTNIENIVDLGCGPGHFGQMINIKGIKYYGYDFSKVAIKKAKNRLSGHLNKHVSVMDLEKDFPKHKNPLYTAFEFFEHIPFDVDIINKLSKDDFIIFSVPSFDTESHVQHFPTYEDVYEKYEKHLNGVQIIFSAGGTTPEGIKHIIYVVLGRKK